MKRSSYFFVILLSFLVSGCTPHGIIVYPTLETQIKPHSTLLPKASTSSLTTLSSRNGTQIATISPGSPIVTNTTSSTPLAYDTLEPSMVFETIQLLMKDPMDCNVPCFWGAIPGKTHEDEVKVFFQHLGFTPFEGILPDTGDYFFTIGYDVGKELDVRVTYYFENFLVDNIVITPKIFKQGEGIPREWIAYSPETLIKKYGKPTKVEFAQGLGPNVAVIMILYFQNFDLIALYSGYNIISDSDSPFLCPLSAPFDYVRLWLGPNPPNPPSFETISLEKATALTIDQFSQMMLGDPKTACFTLNGDAFP